MKFGAHTYNKSFFFLPCSSNKR